jgi:outer membrane lipoprotein
MFAKRAILITFAALCLPGCMHVFSSTVREKVNTDLSFAALLEDPTSYEGECVLLGGVIVKLTNREDGTLLEIYQTELNNVGKPIGLDESQGRFLGLLDHYVDAEIYRKGRRVTVVGIVRGEEVRTLGEIDYHYPFLAITDIHLWKEELPYWYGPYPWPYWDHWWYRRDPWGYYYWR